MNFGRFVFFFFVQGALWNGEINAVSCSLDPAPVGECSCSGG